MGKLLSLEDFIKRSRLKHQDKYDYSSVEYKNQLSPVKIICPEHGIFEQIPKSHMIGHGCKKCMSEKLKNVYRGKSKIHKLQDEKIILKLKEIFDYDYSDAYINHDGRNSTINNIKCDKHGYFNKRLTNHLRQNQGCSFCGSNKLSKEDFINKSNNTHQNKYDYSEAEYINSKTKLKINCPEHGPFLQSPSKHMDGQGCPICYKKISSKGESFIEKYLMENNIKFIPQYKLPGTRLSVDFFIPTKNLCIEYDGIQHFQARKKFGGNYEFLNQIERDNIKDKWIKEKKINFVRISYKDYKRLKEILDNIFKSELKYIKSFENYTKKYENFNQKIEDDILYIFDFDDTIVDSPRFEELVIELIKEDVTIKSLLDKSLKFVNKSIKDLRIDNGRLYVEDPKQEIPVKGNWVRKKNGHLYLVAPDKFYFTDFSLPTGTTQLSKFYNQVSNKAIVTGRTNVMKTKVLDKLKEFGLEEPNYGLFCFPTSDTSSNKIAIWKGKTIVELINKTGFKRVKFYDDKSKWVNKVTQIVKEQKPEIDFEGIKVK